MARSNRKKIMKGLAFIVVLFACSVPTFAQLPDTPSSPAQIPDSQPPDKTKPLAQGPDAQKNAQSKTNNGANAISKKTTMVGCISEHDGEYLLMTQKQSSGIELISTGDLKAHVGHKVKVTGTMGNGSSIGNGARSSSNAMPENNAHDRTQQESSMGSHNSANGQLRVTKMKMISQSCDMKTGKSSEKSWASILSL
jgi:hypothetical protein